MPITGSKGRPITTLPGLPTSAPLPSTPQPQPQPSAQPNNNNPYVTFDTPQATTNQPNAPDYTAIPNTNNNSTTGTTGITSTGTGTGSYTQPPAIYSSDQTNNNSTD